MLCLLCSLVESNKRSEAIIFHHSDRNIQSLWNIIRNDTGKVQRVEKISEMNLEAGNIENAKEMACVFNKLFLLTVIVDTNTDSSLAMDLVTELQRFW